MSRLRIPVPCVWNSSISPSLFHETVQSLASFPSSLELFSSCTPSTRLSFACQVETARKTGISHFGRLTWHLVWRRASSSWPHLLPPPPPPTHEVEGQIASLSLLFHIHQRSQYTSLHHQTACPPRRCSTYTTHTHHRFMFSPTTTLSIYLPFSVQMARQGSPVFQSNDDFSFLFGSGASSSRSSVSLWTSCTIS